MSFGRLSAFTSAVLLDLLFPTPHELRYNPAPVSKESFMNCFRFIFFATYYTDLLACLTASPRQRLYFCHEPAFIGRQVARISTNDFDTKYNRIVKKQIIRISILFSLELIYTNYLKCQLRSDQSTAINQLTNKLFLPRKIQIH